ncbi:hypothetical protein MS3_00001307 [Schistosoma haematobium]|uniref:Uncharacterized protein n=1 Tax=Schistosoma haematobium TaxID=6185 RepID=A0A922LT25_SCHHA|nr:hypothetical protein MS3_00001307 [Schistosoma haematobium]KAH9592873.1 hypothetical protein MS3_00001307 [Schistosoma haematobium]
MPHNARHIHSRIYTYVPNISLIYIILCETLIVKKVICSGSAVLPDVNNDINDTFGQDESEQRFTQSTTEENKGDDDHDEKEKFDKQGVKKMEYAIVNDSVDENDHNIIMNININANEGHGKQPDNGGEIFNDFLH